MKDLKDILGAQGSPDKYFKKLDRGFEPLDIVQFIDANGNIKRGYINTDMQIRCLGPVYETHPIYVNTIMVKKQGWS
ncbi:MAG: hypothetical protein KAJ18_07445 [Candidatus Omnitrophica bacterium]|nr:hypothetical protein [Candidatus Omnitrophota bacterium]